MDVVNLLLSWARARHSWSAEDESHMPIGVTVACALAGVGLPAIVDTSVAANDGGLWQSGALPEMLAATIAHRGLFRPLTLYASSSLIFYLLLPWLAERFAVRFGILTGCALHVSFAIMIGCNTALEHADLSVVILLGTWPLWVWIVCRTLRAFPGSQPSSVVLLLIVFASLFVVAAAFGSLHTAEAIAIFSTLPVLAYGEASVRVWGTGSVHRFTIRQLLFVVLWCCVFSAAWRQSIDASLAHYHTLPLSRRVAPK